MPTKNPCAKLICPAKPETIFSPQQATEIKKDVVNSKTQYSDARKQSETAKKTTIINQNF